MMINLLSLTSGNWKPGYSVTGHDSGYGEWVLQLLFLPVNNQPLCLIGYSVSDPTSTGDCCSAGSGPVSGAGRGGEVGGWGWGGGG